MGGRHLLQRESRKGTLTDKGPGPRESGLTREQAGDASICILERTLRLFWAMRWEGAAVCEGAARAVEVRDALGRGGD